ncbi:MAG: peptidylprolyl isomerase [Betaproteobacteria bacterium]|nr:peptidylprolyl isomerase [Betaproteobacteria bacterium]
MNMISRLTAALVLGGLLTCSVQAAEDKADAKASSPSKAVATVNGVAISKNLLDDIVADQKGVEDTPQLRQAILDDLISRELLLQEAKKKGLDKDKKIVMQMTLMRDSVLINAFVQEYVRTHPITDEQLKKKYDELVAKNSGTEYKARHILVKTEDEAKAIIESLKKGEKFEELAKKSEDPGSKEKGGDLGWSPASTYVPPFADALGKLAKGKFTETPVKTDFGWHVIQLQDTRPIEQPPFDAVKPQIQQAISKENVDKMIDDLKKKAKITK